MPAKMIMMKFNNKELKEAMGKLTGFIGATVVFECTSRPTKEDATKYYAKLRASNGVAQAATMLTYSGDAEDRKIIFNQQFLSAVDSLSVFGEELHLEPLDGAANVSCGSAFANVPYASDAATITSPDFKKVPALILQLKKEDFRDAVCQGAYVQEDTSSATYSKTCCIKPCAKENGERAVKFMSFSGLLYGECECPVAIQEDKAAELFTQWTEKGLIVKSPALTSIARSVSTDLVYLYLSDAQLVVTAGTDVYNYVAVEGKFQNLSDIVAKRTVKDFSMTLDKSKLKSAFKVIGLYTENGDASLAADLTMEETDAGKVKVTVKDINGKNEVVFEADGFGSKELRVNKGQLSRAMDSASGDTVTIHGAEGTTYVFIEGTNERAFSFNVVSNKK